MAQHMIFHKNNKTNRCSLFNKSGAFIALWSICAAFFIAQQISADDISTTTSGTGTEKETETSEESPTEISTEKEEETKIEKEISPQPESEEKEEKITINEQEDVEKIPKETPPQEKSAPETPTEISTEEAETLQDDEKSQDDGIVDELLTADEKPESINKDILTDASAESTKNTPPQLQQDTTDKGSLQTEKKTITSPDKTTYVITNSEEEIPQENILLEEEEDDASADIVISEIHINGTNDWIELYNQTDTPIDLAAQKYRIERATKSGGDPKYYLEIGNTSHGIFPHGTTIEKNGYYLITDEDAPNEITNIADAIIHKKRSFTLTKDNTIYLATGSVGKPHSEYHEDNDIVDYIGYGKAVQYEGQPANNPHTGESLIRKNDNSCLIDTNNNSDDFITTNKPTPTNSRGEADNDPDEETSIIDYEKFGIHLNEIFPNPKGSDKKGYEFIEIINTGSQKVDISAWEIETISKNGVSKRKTLSDINKENMQLLPGGLRDFPFSLTNSFFTIRLYAPDGNLIDETAYNNAKEGKSWNYHKNNWYWTEPTPGRKNQEDPQTKDYPRIRINEILPDPRFNEQKNEFIELYNPTNKPVKLRDWVIKDATKTGHYSFASEVIPPMGYLVIYRSTFKFALNNTSKETLSLIAPNDKLISTISYIRAREGQSFNYHESLWYWTQKTPWKKNGESPLTKNYPFIFINEILPNPIGLENENEYIELYNPNNYTVSLSGWALSDSSKTGLYVMPHGTQIYAHSFVVIYRRDFSFALNNSGGETISLLAPNTKIKSFVSYKKAREEISYNFTGEQWRWSKHLTPGRKNIFNNLPEITRFDTDKKAYRDVYVNFRIKAKDRDHEELKVRWDFGDGRKSYLWKTRHKYTETGTYDVSVRIQDESEEITKKFQVFVKKYPRRKVSIIAILPNPAGKDVEGEYIIIENESKKKIKLRGWSIATGSTEKKLVNHPIREKITAQAQTSQKVTRKHAAITLPNKKGVVELRRPDGSTADTVLYERATSIKDDVLYMKINGIWTWIEPLSAMSTKLRSLDINASNQIIATAFANEHSLSQRQNGSILDARSEQITTNHLHISSLRTFFEKILSSLTIILHKILIWFT